MSASEYNSYRDANPVITSFRMTGEVFSSTDEYTRFPFITRASAGSLGYNLRIKGTLKVNGDSGNHFHIHINEGVSGTRVFKWTMNEATPSLNTYGWVVNRVVDGDYDNKGDVGLFDIMIPPSDQEWELEIRLNDEIFFVDDIQFDVSVFHGENTVKFGEHIIIYAAGWGSVSSGEITRASAETGLLGSIPVTGDGYIRFLGNGSDSGSMSNQTIANYASANLTANAFSLTGYNFVEWNTLPDGSGTSYLDSASYTMSYLHDQNLYAQWEVI